MSNNKQSSVEYLMDKLFDPSSMVKEQLEWFEKAKAMHKEEIEKVWIDAYTTNMKAPIRDNFILWAKNYYNETFGGNK